MKKLVKLLSLLIVACMIFSACAPSIGAVSNNIVDNTANNTVADTAITDIENTDTANNNVVENVVDDAENTENIASSIGSTNTEEFSSSSQNSAVPEEGTYNEGVALVK